MSSGSELLNFVLSHDLFRKNRLPSLYSDFRYLRTTNPNGFAANLNAWKTVLRDAAKKGVVGEAGERLVLSSGEELVAELATREWGRPLGLGAVVDEAVATHEWIPLSQFLSQRESIYYKSWTGAIVTYGLGLIGLKSPPGASQNKSLSTGKFVLVKNVEDTAKRILQQISSKPSKAARIFPADLFRKEFCPTLSQTDLSVLVVFLTRDLKEAVTDGSTIKFKNPTGELEGVTEQDTTIAQLKSLISSFHLRETGLSSDIAAADAKARTAVTNKNRTIALAALKSKKTAEGALETLVKALGQVEEVLVRIEQAADNVELVRQLEASSKVLKGLNKEVGGVERVDDVMEGLRTEMEDVDEVTRILGETTGREVDDGEVEDELDAMLKEEHESMKEEEDRKRLPEVPTREPLSRTMSPEDKLVEEELSKSLEDVTLGRGDRDKNKNKSREERVLAS